MRPRGHRLAEARSLALHREIARRLRDDPGLLLPVTARVKSWLETGEVSEHYARAWSSLLDGPRDALSPSKYKGADHYLTTNRTTMWDDQARVMVSFYKLKLEDDTRYAPYLYGGMEPKDALSRYEFTFKP